MCLPLHISLTSTDLHYRLANIIHLHQHRRRISVRAEDFPAHRRSHQQYLQHPSVRRWDLPFKRQFHRLRRVLIAIGSLRETSFSELIRCCPCRTRLRISTGGDQLPNTSYHHSSLHFTRCIYSNIYTRIQNPLIHLPNQSSVDHLLTTSINHVSDQDRKESLCISRGGTSGVLSFFPSCFCLSIYLSVSIIHITKCFLVCILSVAFCVCFRIHFFRVVRLIGRVCVSSAWGFLCQLIWLCQFHSIRRDTKIILRLFDKLTLEFS